MNEFIVWDKKLERFADINNFLIGADGKVCNLNGEELDNNVYIVFQYIEKKDINDKKIYADCSIFEFDFYIDDSFGWMNWRSSFTYDCGELCFNILRDGKLKRFSPISHEIRNIKIIGTIQENPELMEIK